MTRRFNPHAGQLAYIAMLRSQGKFLLAETLVARDRSENVNKLPGNRQTEWSGRHAESDGEYRVGAINDAISKRERKNRLRLRNVRRQRSGRLLAAQRIRFRSAINCMQIVGVVSA